MKALSEIEFLDWAKARGLAIDPRYPKMAVLSFEGQSDARFWEVPSKPQRRPYFFASLLELSGEWRSCFVWRHMGSWPAADSLDRKRVNDVVEYEILKGLGLPMGTGDVIEFDRTEMGALVTLLLSTSIFGWSVGEDLYLAPDSGWCLMQTDHHDAFHVEFRDGKDVELFVRGMDQRGFPLPDELPDETFKRPDWIPKDEN